MDASPITCHARHLAGLSLREMAAEAATSHSTLSAYESGRVDPSVSTLARVVRAAGMDIEVTMTRRVRVDPDTGLDRGKELLAVLELAAEFPAALPGKLEMPIFARVDDAAEAASVATV